MMFTMRVYTMSKHNKFGFLSHVSKLYFPEIEYWFDGGGSNSNSSSPSNKAISTVHICERNMCIVVFISEFPYASNTIFVQFIMTRCLFCFNKLPQNEFTITCSISSAIILPGAHAEREYRPKVDWNSVYIKKKYFIDWNTYGVFKHKIIFFFSFAFWEKLPNDGAWPHSDKARANKNWNISIEESV